MSKTARGDIWTVNLEPTIGAEITKTRPAVILNMPQVGRLPLVIVVPITEWNPVFDEYVWFIRLLPTAENGLTKASAADAFQVKSISELRLVRRMGQMASTDLDAITAAVALCIGYRHPVIR